MVRCRTTFLIAWTVQALACGSDEATPADDLVEVATDVPDAAEVPTDLAAEGGDLTPGDTTEAEGAGDTPTEVAPPKCLGQLDSELTFALTGLGKGVEFVRDKWGIPHLYAETAEDLFAAQGFVTGMDRIIQMQGMRLITRGTYASTLLAGASDLTSDVYMRVLDLRGTAEKIWTDIQANEPSLKAVLEAYARGVNAYIDATKAGLTDKPLEWDILGQWDPWTPVDSLTIGRLQSWDLSFDQYTDEVSMSRNLSAMGARIPDATYRKALAADAYRFAPATNATVLPPVSDGVAPKPPASAKTPTLPPGTFDRVWNGLQQVKVRPDTIKMGGGSNNWVVAGKLTTSGNAILANDPHLALRNPAVFYLVHLDTARAGGDLALSGVSFPGIPGIILGHNARAAWAATVHNYDATDVYLETLTDGTPPTAAFNGTQVPLTIRHETFTFKKPTAGCGAFLEDFVTGLPYKLTEDATTCTLVADIWVVPHHGPIIPGSKTTAGDKIMALSWRWTGFEPTKELKAVLGLWTMKTPDDFFAALKDFRVGAQNWLYADVDGHIAYAAYARVPIRKNLQAGDKTNPPWLPMPGDGSCEWMGDVPLEQLPQARDPAVGYIVTANNDAVGTTLDNDPLNDVNYLAQSYDVGFRAARIDELLTTLISSSTKIGVADLQAIQADHRSPLGVRMLDPLRTMISAALDELKTPGTHPNLAAAANLYVKPNQAAFTAALPYLLDWDGNAASGVGDTATLMERKSSVATSIVNAWLVELEHLVFDNKGLSDLEDEFKAKVLTLLFTDPTRLATYDAGLKDSRIWDDPATVAVETRADAMLQAMAMALAFLSDPAKVGVGQQGGFGTSDLTQWNWGRLHTLTLKYPLGGNLDIPPASQYPDGQPRPGDNYCVDAANPGLSDFDFTYSHGPSQRPVYLLQAGLPTQNALPGGESGMVTSKHYRDDFALYATNQTHAVDFQDAEVIADAEQCIVFTRP